jgi:hypothetical protein
MEVLTLYVKRLHTEVDSPALELCGKANIHMIEMALQRGLQSAKTPPRMLSRYI